MILALVLALACYTPTHNCTREHRCVSHALLVLCHVCSDKCNSVLDSALWSGCSQRIQTSEVCGRVGYFEAPNYFQWVRSNSILIAMVT